MTRPRAEPHLALLAAAVLLLAHAARAGAEDDRKVEWGGDVRYYQFFTFDSSLDRQDAEIFVTRLKLETYFTEGLRFAADAVVGIGSPPAILRSDVVSAGTSRYFDLEYVFLDEEDSIGIAELDRLFVRWDTPSFQLVAGRQAITWGVNYFWPTLDLFAPFTPQQIDRDYKAGVDAVRGTIATGAFSQVEVVFAAQGRDLPDDGSLGSLGRFQVGNANVGFMGGSFHTDTVLGGFVTTDALGTGLRGEISFTDSGDDRDAEIDRAQFVRASAGFDRQLTTDLILTLELSWNGYGAGDPADYPLLLVSDRVRRGEINSLGRAYTGLSLNWQLHPLWTLGSAVLTNWSDGSVLVQPSAVWSTSDNTSVLFGIIQGIGPSLDADGGLRSEYGAASTTVWAAGKFFF